MPIPKTPAYPKELSKAAWEKAKGTFAKLFDAAKLKLISEGLGHAETQMKQLDPNVLSSLDRAESLDAAQAAARAIQGKLKGIGGMCANLRKFAPEAKKIGDELGKGATTKATGKTVLAISQKAVEFANQMESFASAIDVACIEVLKLVRPSFDTAMGNGKLKAALKEYITRDQKAVEVFNFIDFCDKGITADNANVAYLTFINPKTAKYQINTGGPVMNGLAAIYKKVVEKQDPKEQIQVWKDNWGEAKKQFDKANTDNRNVTLGGDMYPRFTNSKYMWAVMKP